MRRPLHAMVAPLLALQLAATPALAQDRQLLWPAMHVDARLDSAGVLHVRERQTMLFSGDWNGGQRTFNLRVGQRLTLERLVRVDSVTEREVELVEGDLEEVDEYGWGEGRTLRWRSRLPTDPPFNLTSLTYVLEYRYSNILVPSGDGFELRHDFAFSDREGVIGSFTATLAIDPAWRTAIALPERYGPASLPPGEGFVIAVPFRFVGAGRPSGVVYGADALPRYTLAGALAVLLLMLGQRFFRREWALGKFEPPIPESAVTREWLATHVLALPPEVVGAAWDDSTGAAEVTAVLARLEQEGKVRSRVETTKVLVFSRNTLHLELTTPRNGLVGYERALIDALFVDGGTHTTTDRIRQHYKSTGFAPAEKIRAQLKDVVDALAGDVAVPPSPTKGPTAALVMSGIALLVAGCVVRPSEVLLVLGGGASAVGLYVLALIQAALWRSRVERAAPHALRFVVPLLVLAWALVVVLTAGLYRAGVVVLAGFVLLVVGLTRSALNMAMSRHGEARLRVRRNLAAARRYIQLELGRPEPRLRDEWFPYLIAFGLGPHMDRWFQSFGGASTSRPDSGMVIAPSSSGSHSQSSGSGGGWTGFGGGGGFAGGGSSGAWVAAASSMASGVSAPSSSSSGGSSSGGSSSSGGGGGGGW